MTLLLLDLRGALPLIGCPGTQWQMAVGCRWFLCTPLLALLRLFEVSTPWWKPVKLRGLLLTVLQMLRSRCRANAGLSSWAVMLEHLTPECRWSSVQLTTR